MSIQRDYDVGPFGDVAPVWGDRLWDFLNQSEVIRTMQIASDAGLTAAGSIGNQLWSVFGADVRQDRVKQFVGRLIRQVMEEHGYRHLSQGFAAQENPVFVKASHYISRET